MSRPSTPRLLAGSATALIAILTTGAASATTPPVTDAEVLRVEHEFGVTEIDGVPKRVVSIGLTEQDALLALGVEPVAVTEWYGGFDYATWPWAIDELGGAEPEVLTAPDGFDYERIASLAPDLIIGTNAGIDEESYALLSAIAPTVAQPSGSPPYFGPWDDQTLLIGAAVGQPDEARQLVDEVRGRFADAAAAHPEFSDVPAVFLQNAFYDGNAIAYQDGLSTAFLTDLGFVIPSEIDEFVDDTAAQAFIPLEQLSVLDAAEVLIWATENDGDRAALEEEPVYLGLQPVREGRQVFTGGLLSGAIYFTSVLSLPYVLETLVPALADTLAGDGPVTVEVPTTVG